LYHTKSARSGVYKLVSTAIAVFLQYLVVLLDRRWLLEDIESLAWSSLRSRGIRIMAARWIVTCPKCKKEFTHTDIRAMATGVGTRNLFVSLQKPTMPEGGTELKCQHCGKPSTYRRFDLLY